VPITLGQVFGAYADAVRGGIEDLNRATGKLHEVSLGATAVGTGLNTHPGYRESVVRHLKRLTHLPLRMESNYFLSTNSLAPVVRYSSALKNLAVELDKIAGDLRLYASGPFTAIGELKLPELQPGSSIMPGKVNPVAPELMNQISYAVQGNDLTIDLCARNGQLQLNVMGPMALHKIAESMRLMTYGMTTLAEKCIAGIQPNTERIQDRLAHSTVLVTALNPHIGYAKAAEVAKRIVATGQHVAKVAADMDLKSKDGQPLDLEAILSPQAMTSPGRSSA
jgi:aspartate ammonia-lyase